jgi:hypothetical protein
MRILIYKFFFYFLLLTTAGFSNENNETTRIKDYIKNNKSNIAIYNADEFSKIEKNYNKINLSKKNFIYKKISSDFYIFDFHPGLINSIINFKVSYNKNWKIYFVLSNINAKTIEWSIKYVPLYLHIKLKQKEFIELNENFHIKTTNEFNTWLIDESLKNYDLSLGIIYFTEYENVKIIFLISIISIFVILVLFFIRRKFDK